MTSSKASFKSNSFEMNEFSNKQMKKINLASNEISLHFETVLELESRELLPTVHLDFSWTLKISDQQNDWFAKASDSLGSSQTVPRVAMYTS